MQEINPADLVIWSDEDLLVVNKPSGLPTLVDGYNPEAPYLVGIMKSYVNPIWIVHRLDRETSGLIIFARTPNAHRSLNIQFEKRQAHKIYHALVIGNPAWENEAVNLPLRPDGDRKHRTVIDSRRGKSSLTHFRVMERFDQYTLVEATPKTGRTHQIRVHLAALGHPLAVDPLYGDGQFIQLTVVEKSSKREKQQSCLLSRLGLHSSSLDLAHPTSGDAISFTAPYPEDLFVTVEYLRQNTAVNRSC